jgi:hypothetical protein
MSRFKIFVFRLVRTFSEGGRISTLLLRSFSCLILLLFSPRVPSCFYFLCAVLWANSYITSALYYLSYSFVSLLLVFRLFAIFPEGAGEFLPICACSFFSHFSLFVAISSAGDLRCFSCFIPSLFSSCSFFSHLSLFSSYFL